MLFLISEVLLYYTVERELDYRGTSLIRNSPLLGPYSGTVPRVLL